MKSYKDKDPARMKRLYPKRLEKLLYKMVWAQTDPDAIRDLERLTGWKVEEVSQ